jgi:predicted transcriptional regulator
MKINDGAETRRRRMAQIVETIAGNPSLDEKQIKAFVVVQSGVTYKRIEQYIAELLAAGTIKRENDKLRLMTG